MLSPQRQSLFLLLVLAAILSHCSEDSDPASPSIPDDFVITDLTASILPDSTLMLEWTSPSPNTASSDVEYEIRTSQLYPDTRHWWALAHGVEGERAAPIGDKERFHASYDSSVDPSFYAVRPVSPGGPTYPVSNIATVSIGGPAPPPVIDLREEGGSSTSMHLVWTRPQAGTGNSPALYRLRSVIGSHFAANAWESARSWHDLPLPGAPLQIDTHTVAGLDPHTTYTFVLRSVTEDSTYSRYSNPVVRRPSAPAAIADLALTESAEAPFTLHWTSPADTAGVAVAEYDLRYQLGRPSRSQMETLWDESEALDGLPVPGEPGGAESYSLPAFVRNGTYTLAVRSIDHRNRLSGLSNMVRISNAHDVSLHISHWHPTPGWWTNEEMSFGPWGILHYEVMIDGVSHVTNEDGHVTLRDLPPGTYPLSGSLSGHLPLVDTLVVPETTSYTFFVEPDGYKDYMPLAIGNRWVYSYTNSGGSWGDKEGKTTTGVIALEITDREVSGTDTLYSLTKIESVTASSVSGGEGPSVSARVDTSVATVTQSGLRLSFAGWGSVPPGSMDRYLPVYFPGTVLSPGSRQNPDIGDAYQRYRFTRYEAGVGVIATGSGHSGPFNWSSQRANLIESDTGN